MDVEQEEDFENAKGLGKLVGYKAESFEWKDFLHQFPQSFENSTRESQADMNLTY